MKVHKRSEPIFIVGVPRSGTTLLAAMLAAHSRLSCGTETRFFRFLNQSHSDTLIAEGGWPEEATEFLFNMKLVDIPIPDHYSLGRDQILAFLSQKPASIPTILEALTEQYMYREGKERWVEKSPEHLLFVRDIRRYFPQSPIIRIVRDPRDVALSLNKSPWAPSDFLDALLLWHKYDNTSLKFFQEDQNSLTIKYEMLVQSPEEELKKICNFIGESFESTMLDTSKSADHLVTSKDFWHRIVDKPVDVSRIGVWRRELPKGMNRLAEALIGDRIHAYGYERIENFDAEAEIYPSLEALVSHRQALSMLVEKGICFWVKSPDVSRAISIYVGGPDENHWLRYAKLERWRDIFRIIARIFWNKFRGRHVYWIRKHVSGRHPGFAARVITSVFKLAESRLD